MMKILKIILTVFSFFLTYTLYADSPKATELKIVARETANKILFEINPLILANQGMGLNFEGQILQKLSLGLGVEKYEQNPYNRNCVQARRTLHQISPFIRYYFLANIFQGLFIGTKINLIYSQASIADGIENISDNKYITAPSFHLGYRFIFNHNLTLSAYAGAGIKSSSNKFSSALIPTSRANNQDWYNAIEKINEHVSQIQSDYGLTIGYIF